MSDIIDDTSTEHEVHIKAALSVRKPSLPFIGLCHYCNSQILKRQHFCDADCRHDYERLTVNGSR